MTDSLFRLENELDRLLMRRAAIEQMEDAAYHLSSDRKLQVQSILSEELVDCQRKIGKIEGRAAPIRESERLMLRLAEIEAAERRRDWLSSVKREAKETGRTIEDVVKERPYEY